MAEESVTTSQSEVNIKQEGFRDTCSLCFESYRKRTPKLLPCFHTFCLPCLIVLVQSAESEKMKNQTDDLVDPSKDLDTEAETVGETPPLPSVVLGSERGGGEGGSTTPVMIACPTCRALIPVPEGGAASLQTNFYLTDEEQSPSAVLLCEMCEADEAKEATHQCSKCRQRMCPACKRLHDKITNPREHPVRPVTSTDAVPPPKSAPPSVKCSTHVDQDLCFFCKTCDVPVCLHCKLTSHQPHVTEDMMSAALRGKERVREFVTTARNQIQVLEKAISRLTRNEKELAREKQEVTEEIGTRCDEILRWVTRSRGELLESVQAKAESAEASLRAETSRAKDTLENLARLVSSFTNVPDSGMEMWALEKELRAELLKEDALDHFSKLAEEQQQTFLHLTPAPSVLDLGTVRAYVGELEPSGKTLPPLSITQQVQEARGATEELETRLKTVEQDLQQALRALQAKQEDTEKVAEQTKARVESAEARVESAEARVESAEARVESAEARVESAEARLDTVQKRVAFTVWHKTNPLTTTGKGVLVMDHAAVNIGDAYDVTTGIFTAPVAGLYNFQGAIMTYTGGLVERAYTGLVERAYTGLEERTYAGLFIDSGLYAQALSDSGHGYNSQSTVGAVVHLRQGQTACLKNTMSYAGAFCSSEGEPYTSFSGFLVQAD